MAAKILRNFGRNLTLAPRHCFRPESEEEVLKILRENRGARIRVVGRLHSWSEAIGGEEVVLDLGALNAVRIETRAGETWAILGAGCQIKRGLAELDRLGDFTLPSVGLIAEQTIAGAISTGTHGSGKRSLSHYADELRVARWNPDTGEPEIVTIDSGQERQAARCGLGCLGVIVSVGVRCRTQYRIEEHLQFYDRLEEVLEREEAYPLQQFFFLPFLWRYLAQHRREVDAPRSWTAPLYRIFWFWGVDLGLHLPVLTFARWLRSRTCLSLFFRRVAPLALPRGWRVVDRSQDMLTMEHHLFRHIEIEVFVPRRRLVETMGYVEALLRWAGGEGDGMDDRWWEPLDALGMGEAVRNLSGQYIHHYPICVRRIEPDDTLISMASGGEESWYSISFISYARPRDRSGFFAFATVLAETSATLFGARPHWGKVNPLDARQLWKLYPGMGTFLELARRADPAGNFRNPWLDEILAEPQSGEAGPPRLPPRMPT